MLRCDTAPHNVTRVSDLPRSQLIGYLVVGVVVVLLGALWVRGGGGGDGGGVAGASGGEAAAGADGAATVRVDEGGTGRLVIHVAGAVRRPGVYRLPAGARVAAAVRQAGGPLRRADLNALNLAARLTDGRQVLVPARAVAGGVANGSAAGSPSAGGAPLNLNSATAEQLDELEGIGPETAAKILEYRQEHGGFGSVDELDAVPGIGPARLDALRDRVTG